MDYSKISDRMLVTKRFISQEKSIDSREQILNDREGELDSKPKKASNETKKIQTVLQAREKPHIRLVPFPNQ